MARGWTWIDSVIEKLSEDEFDQAVEERTPILDHLAQEWSYMRDTEERQRFAREADIESGYDYDYEFESEAEEHTYKALQQLKVEQHEAQIRFIETKMHELGARMMRPYEHWAEDERYMQYMECDRYGD